MVARSHHRQHLKGHKFHISIDRKLGSLSVPNQGLVTRVGCAADRCYTDVKNILAYISHYGPTTLHRDIQHRSVSLDNMWEKIKTWPGIQSTGNSHHTYYDIRRSFKHYTILYTDLYYKLFNAKEDCPLTTTGAVTYQGARVTVNERLTACNQSDIVLDWLGTIGGPALVAHIF